MKGPFGRIFIQINAIRLPPPIFDNRMIQKIKCEGSIYN